MKKPTSRNTIIKEKSMARLVVRFQNKIMASLSLLLFLLILAFHTPLTTSNPFASSLLFTFPSILGKTSDLFTFPFYGRKPSHRKADLGDNLLRLPKPVSPDFSHCNPVKWNSTHNLHCCPPPLKDKVIKDYKIPKFTSLRVRRPAHLLDAENIEKLRKAIKIMRELPEDDPRNFNFIQQANVHCAYCQGAYRQEGYPNLEYRIHRSWLFFPYHRWQLYFFERIVQKLIGDEHFAMPFWSWDNHGGMELPFMFDDSESSLFDSNRNPMHKPPELVNLGFEIGVNTGLGKVLTNLNIMYRQMISSTKVPTHFFGGPYRDGEKPVDSIGTIELAPHNALHLWTGLPREPYNDMGIFSLAARDPVFYPHHGNSDRMWVIWRKVLRRKDLSDLDWLESSFIFYDENGEPVRVKVRDCLDIEKLGYVYEDVPIPWLDAKPTPRRRNATVSYPRIRTSNIIFPTALIRELKVTVPRAPKRSTTREEEVLVVNIEEFDTGEIVKFDVFINEEDVVKSGAQYTEFAGSFINVPHSNSMQKQSTLRIGISELLQELGADQDEKLLVSLVPRSGHVIIGGVGIQCEPF